MRALDVMIAERIFGWRWIKFSGNPVCALIPGDECAAWEKAAEAAKYSITFTDGLPEGCRAAIRDCPAYSTDIAAAWLVVEKMQERPGYRGLDLHHDTVSLPSHAWSCEFTVEHLRRHAFAPTQPLSITLAALRALAVPEAEIASASAPPAQGEA